MRYLITGGAGFIGSHLAERLLEKKENVVLLDNLSTGSMENFRHLKSSENLEYHLDGIENKQLLAELVDDADVIVHFAAAVGVKLIVESPVRTIETNVNGTQLILEAASKKKKLVLLASTSEVYGKNTQVPFHEDADLVLGPTTKGRWSYAASKALDEFLALSYWKEKKQPVIVVRFFNTVGPRQTGRYGMVLPNFVQRALKNEPIEVYGDGKQSRCFCDVRDTVEGLLRLIPLEQALGEVVNIGNTEEITIENLAKQVKQRTDSDSPIHYIPYDKAYEPGFEDMMRRVPCIDKLHALTGFRPKTTLAEIIDRVAAYHRQKEGLRASATANRSIA
ncbi:MAG TPA: GDP-mannose 4,6-dehydratase [Candidatus Sulfotelmatobacter sp.]|nr:GDP-mannose 4,6-dehydratase [Candidatus Sulfotelmatobacter sp.]